MPKTPLNRTPFFFLRNGIISLALSETENDVKNEAAG